MSQTLTMAGYTDFSVTDALKPGALHLRWMVLVSLFSWAREEATQSYGWWGSAVTSQRGEFGSFLWKEERSKLTNATVVAVKAHIEQALAWMLRDKVADAIEVEVVRIDSRVTVDLAIIRLGERVDLTFSDLWEALRGS